MRKSDAPPGKFFTGRPCRYGHVSYRYESTGACVECLASRYAAAPKLPVPNVPPCLVGKPTDSHCASCPRFDCGAARVSKPVTRARIAFWDFPPISRADARRTGLLVYKPAEPCAKCGRVAWRSIRTEECAGCHPYAPAQ